MLTKYGIGNVFQTVLWHCKLKLENGERKAWLDRVRDDIKEKGLSGEEHRTTVLHVLVHLYAIVYRPYRRLVIIFFYELEEDAVICVPVGCVFIITFIRPQRGSPSKRHVLH